MQVVVVGANAIARTLGQRLIEAQHEIAFVIERLDDAEEFALDFPSALVIRGSGTDDRSLRSAGAAEAQLLLAVHDDDSHNMAACLLAKERFGVPETVALAASCEDKPTFRALGISSVCVPDVVSDTLLAHALVADSAC